MDISQNGPRIRPQDLANAKDVACESCQHQFFEPVFIIKTISAIASPTGQEVNIPVQTFACAKCGAVNKTFMPEKF